jgi:hypothetical protein
MSRNKCFFQVRISHVLRFIFICDLLTDSPSYFVIKFLTMFFHLRLGLPSGLFPSGFPVKTLCTLLFSPTRATCSAHHTIFDFIIRIIFGK